MFLGTYEHAIDDKGRLAIPARFRGELEDGFYLARGLDHCLMLLKPVEFNELAEKVTANSIFDDSARHIQLHVASGALAVHPDRLGRVVIPQHLRDFAGLTTEVAVIGVFSRIEVWDRQRWLDQCAKTERNMAELTQHLAGVKL